MILVALLFIINFVISGINALAVGHNWAETKLRGGWPRVLNWCGAIMAACGFTWCYTLLGAYAAYAVGYLTSTQAEGVLRLGYLVIIIPVIGSGIGILVESWARFYRSRSLGDGALAAWNTFANAYNVVGAMDAVPGSISFLKDLFTDEDNLASVAAMLVVTIAVLAIIGGIVTTSVVVRWAARTSAAFKLDNLKRGREEAA